MKNFMKKFASALSLAVVMVSVTSCSQSEELAPMGETRAASVVNVPAGVISQNTTWTADNEYYLEGKVYVANATLTIQAGTKIVGAYNSNPDEASALVITRTGKIQAAGTASAPIVMTAEAAHQTPGGWGGFVVLGNAPINQTTQVIEGIPNPGGADITYGGNVANDNSGVIQYVRVEYAGANVAEANELNSFTFGGVGSGTTFDHCQAYYGEDDGFEFFGGTVNAKYLVVTSTHDDAFDFDFGFTGSLQFLVATLDPNSTFYTKDPNGIECDNDGTGSDATPFTHPKISNLTIVGTSNGKVAQSEMGDKVSLKSATNFRRNAQFTLVNSILYGYPTGMLCETSNTNVFKNNIVNGVTTTFSGLTADASNVAAAGTTSADLGLTSPWGGYKTTELVPVGVAASGADTSLNDFFDEVAYKGAIEPTGRGSVNWLNATWVR